MGRIGLGRLMGRLRRFPDNRFVGLRDTMRVYDCDDESQFGVLQTRTEEIGDRNLFQTFGPDTAVEARNRGFRPVGEPARPLN